MIFRVRDPATGEIINNIQVESVELASLVVPVAAELAADNQPLMADVTALHNAPSPAEEVVVIGKRNLSGDFEMLVEP